MILTIIENYWDALVMMMAEMAPYLLLGFFIAGLLKTFVPRTLFSKHLAPRNMKSVVKAAALGIPLPLCSCGVIPTSVSLRKEGASHGACTSFLIATPQTGVDSIAATYSLMGLPFAIVRPIAALFTAMFGGWLVNKYAKEDEQLSAEASKTGEYDHCDCGCDDHDCGCDDHDHCCSGDDDDCDCHGKHHHSFMEKLVGALRYGFVEMLQDVGKWLVIGLLIAALITVAIPNEWLAALHDYKLLNMLIVLLVAIPMYVCATGSIPIAVSLMAKGLTPGAALVLLMAGPAVNSASMLVIGKVFGKRTMSLYVASIIIGAVVFGLMIDYCLPQQWFAVKSAIVSGAHCAHCLTWLDWAFLAVFVLLLINALVKKHQHSHQMSHEHHAGHAHHHDTESHPYEEEMVYKVEGMACNHCAASVKNAIDVIDGVTSVKVDLAKGLAYVKGHHDHDELIKRVSDIGYTASLAE